MNPRLDSLQPYPFEKLRRLLAPAAPVGDHARIDLSIGEPRHPTPPFVIDALTRAMAGLANYPPTKGPVELREAIAGWISRRYKIAAPDADKEVLPVQGSREALFSFAQAVIDPTAEAIVICPNPFYQIYEGAALLAGAQPWYLNADSTHEDGYDFDAIPVEVLRRTQLMYVCSPGNPTGTTFGLETWRRLFALSDQYGFVIAADECYSEIYPDESAPPIGSLEAAARLGRHGYPRLVSFSSLSKRSSLPGLRSGFVAGDATLLERFLLYRTYHGSAMSRVVATASISAWNDEAHVRENRERYRSKFEAVLPVLRPVLDIEQPQGAFFIWAPTPYDDAAFARDLYTHAGITTLPGSFLARDDTHGVNPGRNHIRIALVAPQDECLEAAGRIADFLSR